MGVVAQNVVLVDITSGHQIVLMEKRRVLLLPGSANPSGSEKYRQVYGSIRQMAEKLEYTFSQPEYPGWGRGQLNFHTAFEASIKRCREFQPEWIIGRSLGCDTAVAALSSGEEWVQACKGAVLWGPSVSADIYRIWPTWTEQEEEIRRYAEYGTFLSDDFFDSIPPLENNIAGAACNLRIARGELDNDNTPETISILQRIHARAQPSFQIEPTSIPGLAHFVIGAENPESIEQYFRCLFQPFPNLVR
jgi:hypothetical protein